MFVGRYRRRAQQLPTATRAHVMSVELGADARARRRNWKREMIKMNKISMCTTGEAVQRSGGLCGLGCAGRLAAVVAVLVPGFLASCGWQAHQGVDLDTAPSAVASQPSPRESIETHTYFGAEFGAPHDAARGALTEPRVQAF